MDEAIISAGKVTNEVRFYILKIIITTLYNKHSKRNECRYM